MELTGTNKPCGLAILLSCWSSISCCGTADFRTVQGRLQARIRERSALKVHLLKVQLSLFFYIKFSVVLAKGSHPFPFRTRKLSLSAPMVLHGRLCGRVGRRRIRFWNAFILNGWGHFFWQFFDLDTHLTDWLHSWWGFSFKVGAELIIPLDWLRRIALPMFIYFVLRRTFY